MSVAISRQCMCVQAPVAQTTKGVRRQAAKRVSVSAFKGSRASFRVVKRGEVQRRVVSVCAEEGFDFDKLLATGAEKWEASDKKVPIVGYSIGLLVALYLVESFIHLPVFNVLLGFPLELLGIFSAMALGVRYVKEKQDPLKDLGELTDRITQELPGFKE